MAENTQANPQGLMHIGEVAVAFKDTLVKLV